MKTLKLLLILPIMALFLMAGQCDSDQTVSGSVTLEVPQVRAEFAQINGINYIRTIQAEIITACIALDPSTLYLATFELIGDQDDQRITNYTAEEIAVCS